MKTIVNAMHESSDVRQPKEVERSKKKATFWDKRSKHYDESIIKHSPGYQKTIDSTKSWLSHSDVVLDFACASGEISLGIAPHVQQVYSIDLSIKMIELANQKAQDRKANNVHFYQTDVFDQKLESGSFTAIIALNILHLVDDASGVLGRLNELLQPGGLLISQTPCLGEQGWVVGTLINLAQKVKLVPTILSFKTTELESMVANSGFEIIESKIWNEKDATQWIVARKT